MKKVSIVLPTYNERENINDLISEIIKIVKHPLEIVVVDDDSPDKTWKVVKDMKKKNVKVIRRTNEKGLATALARGIREAKGDIKIWMDCDFTHHPSLLPDLIRPLDSDEFDVVLASRFVKGGEDHRGLTRIITSRLFNWYAQIILWCGIKDLDTGYVAAKKEVFDKIKIMEEGHGEYCIKFLYDASKRGYRIKEIPCVYEDRTRGESKTSENLFVLLKHGLFYGLRVLKMRFMK